MKTQREAPTFYYDGGHRVSLTPDPHRVVIDDARTQECLGVSRVRDLHHIGEELLFGLTLLARDQLTAIELEALDHASALHPVFVMDGATIVVLPEVLVSAPRSLHPQILEMFAEEAHATNQSGENLVMRLVSGRGVDALSVANLLSERWRNIDVSPNLLRLYS